MNTSNSFQKVNHLSRRYPGMVLGHTVILSMYLEELSFLPEIDDI